MLEIRNNHTKLFKLTPITGLSEKDISKIFSVYNKAGYSVKFIDKG